MTEFRLYMAQRLSALIMAPLTIVHLITMIVAVQNGLTVAEITSRTQGSLAWFLFYGLFVIAVSIHAAIGVRGIVKELTSLPGRVVDAASGIFGVFLLVTGLKAVFAVTAL